MHEHRHRVHRALDLCLAAGFDGEKCVHAFEILERHALDLGDTEETFGLDTEDDEQTGETPWTTKLRSWTWERMRGYPATQERREALVRYLDFRSATPAPPPRRTGFS